MEKKTMETLRVMLCGELDDIAKKGTLTHESLDIVKDLLDSMKNLEKIEKYQNEKEMDMMQPMGNDMKGYSQRSMGRYYIDGQYGTGNSYARGGMGGNSYGMNRMGYNDSGGYDNGNSYMYYNPMYDYPMSSRRGGYSRTSSKEEVMEELKDLMRETNDDAVRNAISDAISKMNK